MSIKRFESLSLRLQHTSCRECLWLIGLLFTLICISCVDGVAQSDQVVAREQKAFFEIWLGRELRGDELRKVTDEFIAYFTKRGKDRAGIHDATKLFLEYVNILREHDGTPRAHTLRHRLLEASYFSTDMQNTTELRLLLEPDPVRVVDTKNKRLMTEKDVIAAVNLNNFVKSGGEPHHEGVSREEIDRLAVGLNRIYGNNLEAEWMPRFCTETAALWAGIRQEWPRLTDEEKRAVRTYSSKGFLTPFKSYRMYGRLLGLDDSAAIARKSDDSLDATVFITMRSTSFSLLLDSLLRTQSER